MKQLLFQMGVIIGGGISLLSLGFNLARQTDFLTAVFRAGIVFAVAMLATVVFLQFFAVVLHRFVAEEMIKHNTASRSAAEQHAPPEKKPDVMNRAARLDVPRPEIPTRS